MVYSNIVKAKFIERPNRFIAHCLVDGKKEVVHVKNTGRCKELLVSGCDVFLQHFDSSTRKTAYDLIGVIKGDRYINMDSQCPNKVVKEFIESGQFLDDVTYIKPEYSYGNSRIDFYVEHGNQKTLIEVKGVTLEKDDIAYFPDAPTERGKKHIRELIEAQNNGYESIIFFVIQMNNIKSFQPNYVTDPEFGELLKIAKDNNVKIVAYESDVTSDTINITKEVKVVL